MKKITLLSFMLLGFVLSNGAKAQTLNQNAGWPNAAWTVTGTFDSADPLVFEADPTVSANFAFDDDDAGSGSDDDIAAESPVIDLTAISGAGETWLTVTVDYVYNWYAAGEKLALQYYDADGASWVDWQIIATADTAGAPTDDYCSGTPANFVSDVLNISAFTATQLSGFRYRLYFNDNVNGVGYVYGFCFHSPTITSSTPPTDVLDYYNLQWPPTGTINAGDTFDVYAQAYEAGLTDVTTGQAPGIEAWIGFSSSDTDPSGAGWTWVTANFNTEAGNNDEYTLNLGASVPVTGTYYYASRWRLNGGVYTYGGIQADGSFGGMWGDNNNISGVLTVNGPANDLCSGATALTPGIDFAANALAGQTQLGASDSGETPSPSCSFYDPTDPTGFGGDVWYSVVVPADGNIDIETQGDPAGDGGDTGMSVYSGACGALVEVDCDDDDSTDGNYSLVSISDPTLANQTLYIRVFEYSGNAQLHFQISAYNPTLSVGEVENQNALTYFPNPVKNELTLKAQGTIQNVSIYNMLGQEVLRTAPNTLESDINMNALQTGAYFVKVTINNATETIRIIKQ
ncbi:MAG: T9SS type A sorting domain-containing protein [Gelidibacter sp.]